MTNHPTITGEIIFDDKAKSFSGATIYIRLQRADLQDVPSELITENIIRNVDHDPTRDQRIKFSLYGDTIDTRGTYIVSVHVDVNSDSKINSGDYISTESYPVLTSDYPSNIAVRVRLVE